jgi:hypothetical protein
MQLNSKQARNIGMPAPLFAKMSAYDSPLLSAQVCVCARARVCLWCVDVCVNVCVFSAVTQPSPPPPPPPPPTKKTTGGNNTKIKQLRVNKAMVVRQREREKEKKRERGRARA